MTLDGVMNVSFVDGFEPVSGDTFQLVDIGTATVTGWFSSVVAPTDWWDIANMMSLGVIQRRVTGGGGTDRIFY